MDLAATLGKVCVGGTARTNTTGECGGGKRASPAQAREIDTAIRQLRWGSSLTLVPLIIVAAVGSLIGWLLFQGFTIEQIVDMTYRDHWIFFWWNGSRISLEPRAFWVTALLLGYACQWMAVRSHTMTVDSLAVAIGGPASPRVTRSGLNPFWIIAAIAFCGIRAWWGIPLVLAGAMQRRYVRVNGPKIQAAFAAQVHSSTSGLTKICRTYRCGAHLAPAANFCPRCGMAARAEA